MDMAALFLTGVATMKASGTKTSGKAMVYSSTKRVTFSKENGSKAILMASFPSRRRAKTSPSVANGSKDDSMEKEEIGINIEKTH